MPAVRAKALSSLAVCLPSLRVQQSFWDASPNAVPSSANHCDDSIVSQGADDSHEMDTTTGADVSMMNNTMISSLSQSPDACPKEMSPGVHIVSFADVVRRRSRDQKSAVRKAAVQVRLCVCIACIAEIARMRCCD
jgi:hypothetical protein